MIMPGRQFNPENYRFGFNGKENDNEVKGVGNQQDYGMRIYDGRVARFLSMDPLTMQFPELTPYQFASNTPLQSIDLDGCEEKKANRGKSNERDEGDGSCGDVYHCGAIDNKGNTSTEEGWYSESEYKKINPSYTYRNSDGVVDPHSFDNQGKLIAGLYTGLSMSLIDMGDFGIGLINGKSWSGMYNTVNNLASITNPWSEYGGTLRGELTKWISSSNNWDVYDWSYGAGYVSGTTLLSFGSSSLVSIKSMYGWKAISFGAADYTIDFGIGWSKSNGIGLSSRLFLGSGKRGLGFDLHSLSGRPFGSFAHFHVGYPGTLKMSQHIGLFNLPKSIYKNGFNINAIKGAYIK